VVSEVHTEARRISGLLGLARRAGGIVAGTDAVREAIRSSEARLVIVTRDAAPAQRAKIERTLAGHSVPRVRWGSRADLGAAIGMAPLSAVAVTHRKLAAEMREELETVIAHGAEA
jgi:ribosomal protein L7Ae-like RNA K-turn-binding protein